MTESASPAGQTLRVPIEQLYRACDASTFSFETTHEIEAAPEIIGQDRAIDALRFGAVINRPGFNVFVVGRPDVGMEQAVKELLARAPPRQNPAFDWTYVNNFADPRRPIALALPQGRALEFRDAMRDLIGDLKSALPAAFDSEEYQTRHGAIEQEFQKQQNSTFARLREKAAEKDIAVLRTPMGFTLVPARNGEVVPPDEFNAWPESKRRTFQGDVETLEKDVEQVVHQLPRLDKIRRESVRHLNEATTEGAIQHLIGEKKSQFAEILKVVSYLDGVSKDLIQNFSTFIGTPATETEDTTSGGRFERYEVNVLVTQTSGHVPIVEELHPTLVNLTGAIEHIPLQGALVTNFRLIKAGAIHRANGGYLLLNIRELLTEPFSWAALKRALRRREAVIEDVSRLVGFSSTVTLDPEPIPLDLKVILFGDRLSYLFLSELDPELREHFKVQAEFEDEIRRSTEIETQMANLLAAMTRAEGLKAIDRNGVAAIIEYAARLSGDSGKLSLRENHLRDVLVEANFRAEQAKKSVIGREQVAIAIKERERRSAHIRDKAQEAIAEGIALIETAGWRVGQINGLSVLELGGFAFGRPARISCQVRPGTGRLIDIEREVKLGGPIHSKGVLILSGYLSGRYSLDAPMSVQVSLVFEQSYSGVDGDSASAAELYLLLSALAELPLRQDLAVTGSVNQHGEVQAIGGVNEKIEGFFDVCRTRGLTGTQGVVIPLANVRHLMLRREVVEACAANRFGIYAVATIDQGLELLTGRAAGERGVDGRFPENSVNARVEERLQRFAGIQRDFLRSELRNG